MGRPRLGRWPLLLLLLLLVYVVATATRAAAKGPLRPLRGSFLPRIRGGRTPPAPANTSDITSTALHHPTTEHAVPPPLAAPLGANDSDASGAAAASATPQEVPAPLQNAPRPLKFRIGSQMIRDALFPIYGREVKKFFSMGMIKFLIVFVLTITRDVKDTLIVTSCGAESIAFLKVYGVLPAAAAFTIVYSKLSNLLSKDALYYALVAPFFLFYLVFDVFIYPNRERLHPAVSAAPPPPLEGLSYLLGLYQNWTFALYYIVSEIYSSVSIGLLFWQFANDVITVDEAKRFYPLFGQLSSIAPIIAGQVVARVAERGDFGASLRILTVLTTICGVGIVGLYKYCSMAVQRDADAGRLDATLVKNLQKRPKANLSMQESAQFLLQSRYLRYMATLVLGFGLAINFTDILWKSMVKSYFPNKLDYQRFMGYYSSTVGATTFIVIFFGSNIVKHLGWRIGALATPVMMALLAVPFFLAIFLKGLNGEGSKRMALIAVAFGALMSVLSKATKYALFDPTTQMAYIPLDEESKSKGKAAIDVLGSRVGKSVGALLLQACVVSFGSAVRASYVVGALFYAVIFSWIYSANHLAQLFEQYTAKPLREAAAANAAASAAKQHASAAAAAAAGEAHAQEEESPPVPVPDADAPAPAFREGGHHHHPPLPAEEEEQIQGEQQQQQQQQDLGASIGADAAAVAAVEEEEEEGAPSFVMDDGGMGEAGPAGGVDAASPQPPPPPPPASA